MVNLYEIFWYFEKMMLKYILLVGYIFLLLFMEEFTAMI